MDFPDAPKDPPNAAAIRRARVAKMSLEERLQALRGPQANASAAEKDAGNLETRLRQLRGLPPSPPKDPAARELDAQLSRIEAGGSSLDTDVLVHQMLQGEELEGCFLSSDVGGLRESMAEVAVAVQHDDDLNPSRAKPLAKPAVSHDEVDALMNEAKAALSEAGTTAEGNAQDVDEERTDNPENISDEEINRVMKQLLDEAKPP